MLVKIAHYPRPDLPKIYHSCSVRKEENGFNELIDLHITIYVDIR